MAFEGSLVISGSYSIPMKMIILQSYKVTPNQRQDVDSYRDLNQDLHRNVSNNYKSIVQFDIRGGLSETRLREVIGALQNTSINSKERKYHLTYWNPSKGNYDSGDFYLVQPEYTVVRVEKVELFYDKLTLKFIEY